MRNILYIFEQTMQQLSECLLLLWQHACEITEIYEAILVSFFVSDSGVCELFLEILYKTVTKTFGKTFE